MIKIIDNVPKTFFETEKIPKSQNFNRKSCHFLIVTDAFFLFSGLCVIKKSHLFIVVKNKIQSPKKVISSENSKFASDNGNIMKLYQNILFFSELKNFKSCKFKE